MKKTIVLLMLLMTIPVFSQVRLGSPLDSIRNEFSAPSYNVQSGTVASGDIYYAIFTPMAKIVYFFDVFNHCYIVQIIPITKDALSQYGEKYNRDFTIISEVHWKANIDNAIADVYLTYPDSLLYPAKDGYKPYFTWFFADK